MYAKLHTQSEWISIGNLIHVTDSLRDNNNKSIEYKTTVFLCSTSAAAATAVSDRQRQLCGICFFINTDIDVKRENQHTAV